MRGGHLQARKILMRVAKGGNLQARTILRRVGKETPASKDNIEEGY